MDQREFLANQFEENRTHLRSVAYRMLGSLSDAEDAVQETWFRLNRTDTSEVSNLGGWLTTVVARVCLDMLRSRRSRREEPLEVPGPQSSAGGQDAVNPEDEALLADSVGLALLVVLENLAPAERVAFVLHDVFAVPFDEIAPIVGRSEVATRQMASRARRRVQGMSPSQDRNIRRQRDVVEAFLAAARGGNFEALLAVLDPDVVLRADPAAAPSPVFRELRGAEAVAKASRAGGARAAQAALVNGAVGLVVAPQGRLMMVLAFTIAEDRITEMDVIADPERLRGLDIKVLDA